MRPGRRPARADVHVAAPPHLIDEGGPVDGGGDFTAGVTKGFLVCLQAKRPVLGGVEDCGDLSWVFVVEKLFHVYREEETFGADEEELGLDDIEQDIGEEEDTSEE